MVFTLSSFLEFFKSLKQFFWLSFGIFILTQSSCTVYYFFDSCLLVLCPVSVLPNIRDAFADMWLIILLWALVRLFLIGIKSLCSQENCLCLLMFWGFLEVNFWEKSFDVLYCKVWCISKKKMYWKMWMCLVVIWEKELRKKWFWQNINKQSAPTTVGWGKLLE